MLAVLGLLGGYPSLYVMVIFWIAFLFILSCVLVLVKLLLLLFFFLSYLSVCILALIRERAIALLSRCRGRNGSLKI